MKIAIGIVIVVIAVIYGAPLICAADAVRTSEIQPKALPGVSSIKVDSTFFGYQSAVDRDLTGGEPAYDYSVHIIKDLDWNMYRMYAGGRWKTSVGDGDHVLQYISKNAAAGTWFARSESEFRLGYEDGINGKWWSRNCLEPEVLRVDGLYRMFWQVEIGKDDPVDTGEKSLGAGDRIGLSTSKDGVTWDRKTDRGVVINIDNPAAIKLTHEEAIYVPDDPDGKPWWLYMFHFVDGAAKGHVRLRSNTPDTFDWTKREQCSGMSQIGNQIAYANDTPAGRVFVRITFAADGATGRLVPSLQFSKDGLNWWSGEKGLPLLEGSDNAEHKNCYFLGISTIDGTGELERVAKNRYKAIYGATTCETSVAPAIFYSEIGVGQVEIEFKP